MYRSQIGTHPPRQSQAATLHTKGTCHMQQLNPEPCHGALFNASTSSYYISCGNLGCNSQLNQYVNMYLDRSGELHSSLCPNSD